MNWGPNSWIPTSPPPSDMGRDANWEKSKKKSSKKRPTKEVSLNTDLRPAVCLVGDPGPGEGGHGGALVKLRHRGSKLELKKNVCKKFLSIKGYLMFLIFPFFSLI